MVLEVTYRCREKDTDGTLVEGENAYRVRVKDVRARRLLRDWQSSRADRLLDHVEALLRNVEFLLGREFVSESISDIRDVTEGGLEYEKG